MATNYSRKKVTATTADTTHKVISFSRAITMYNAGDADVQVEFDTAVSADSFLLANGKALSLPAVEDVTIHFKTASGTATVYVLAVEA